MNIEECWAEPYDDIPEEVQSIALLLVKSAIEAGEPIDSCYFDRDGDEWRLGDNYERGYETLIFRDGKWSMRNPWTGEDFPVKNVEAEVEFYWSGI